MRLRDLLNSCHNQFIYFYKKNPLFTVILKFDDQSDNILEGDYVLRGDYIQDDNYLLKYSERDVISWSILGINDLIVLISGHY